MSQDGKDKKGELSSFAYPARGCTFEQSIGMYRDVCVSPFYEHTIVNIVLSVYSCLLPLQRKKRTHVPQYTDPAKKSDPKTFVFWRGKHGVSQAISCIAHLH